MNSPHGSSLTTISPILPGPLVSTIGKGGFGVVFADPRQPATHCIKKYKTPLSGKEVEQLIHLASVDSWARPSDADLIKSTFAWPIEVFGNTSSVVGFAMQALGDRFKFDLKMKSGVSYRRLLETSYLLDGSYFRSSAVDARSEIVYSLQDRIGLALSICEAVAAIHRYDLVYQDISSKNIIASSTGRPSCFLLDADSITSPEMALQNPVMSPGWNVTINLDPTETDRARLALMVLRLITHDQNLRPETGASQLARMGFAELASAISETYSSGSLVGLEMVMAALRSARDEARAHEAVEDAIRSRFARRLLRESIHLKSSTHLQYATLARQHVGQEANLDSASVKEQRRILKLLRSQNNFKIDVPQSMGVMPLPTTEEQLIQLAFDAEFQDIATHLVRSGLPGLSNHRLIPRLIDRAIKTVSDGELFTSARPGIATFDLHWPVAEFVTCAEVEISIGSQSSARELIHRGLTESKAHREIRVDGGGALSLKVTFGSQGPDGKTFFQRTPNFKTVIDVPPVPRPTSSPKAAVNSSVTTTSVMMVDLVEEARLAEEARRLKRKTRRKRWSIAVLLTIAAVSGFVFYKSMVTDDIKPTDGRPVDHLVDIHWEQLVLDWRIRQIDEK